MKQMRWKWIVLAVTYGAAFAANVGYFWWSWNVGFLQTAATVLYLAAGIGIFWTERSSERCMHATMVLSALTLAAGLIGVLIRGALMTSLMLPGILLAGVFVTPLYGLLGRLPDFDSCYAVTAALGFAGVLATRYFRNLLKKNIGTTEMEQAD